MSNTNTTQLVLLAMIICTSQSVCTALKYVEHDKSKFDLVVECMDGAALLVAPGGKSQSGGINLDLSGVDPQCEYQLHEMQSEQRICV